MYQKTLYPKTRQVLEKLKTLDLLDNFYLAGGTGLALQIGHRKSIDLDFFTQKYPGKQLILSKIKDLKPKVIQDNPGTLDTMIQGVKVSFLEYRYPLLEDFSEFDGIKIASIIDIACMKISAISSRGSKKDFVDLYFILQKHSFTEVFQAFEKKFKGVKYQKLHLIKSAAYFADANKDPDPEIIDKIGWDKIKNSLEGEVKAYFSKM